MLLEQGYDARAHRRLAASCRPTATARSESIDEDRLGALGRATLRTVTALDRGARPEHGPNSYVTAVSQVMPGWVLSLLAGTLLLPALVAAVDAFARAPPPARGGAGLAALGRRPGWRPFLAGLAIAELLALAGATPPPPPAPVPPDVLPLDGAALGVLAGVAAAMVLALRAGALPGRAARSAPGAARSAPAPRWRWRWWRPSRRCCCGWRTRTPGCWRCRPRTSGCWCSSPRVQPNRRVRGLLLALGALPALLVAVYYMFALSMDPLTGAWYLLLLVTGHTVGLLTALVGCVMLGVLCASAELVYRSPAEARRSRRRRPGRRRSVPGSPSAGSPADGASRSLRGPRAPISPRTGRQEVRFPMMSTMSKDALARLIARGEYVVDPHAVAEAMLRARAAARHSCS